MGHGVSMEAIFRYYRPASAIADATTTGNQMLNSVQFRALWALVRKREATDE